MLKYPRTMKIIGWSYIFLAALSLVTAILSFLRSGDTFVNRTPYLILALINLILFFYYWKLGGALKKDAHWAKQALIVTLPVTILVLIFSYFFIYSLLFSIAGQQSNSKSAPYRNSQTPQPASASLPSAQPEFILFNGRKLLIRRVSLGEYCEGRIGSTQTTYPECERGLQCQFREGTAQDAPGVCVK